MHVKNRFRSELRIELRGFVNYRLINIDWFSIIAFLFLFDFLLYFVSNYLTGNQLIRLLLRRNLTQFSWERYPYSYPVLLVQYVFLHALIINLITIDHKTPRFLGTKILSPIWTPKKYSWCLLNIFYKSNTLQGSRIPIQPSKQYS